MVDIVSAPESLSVVTPCSLVGNRVSVDPVPPYYQLTLRDIPDGGISDAVHGHNL